MSNQPTIGAYLIVRDEEECLGACLESIKDLDEIKILDTGSQDGTEAVVKDWIQKTGANCQYIAGVYEWQDSFCLARNKCMEYATAEFLLVVDADEILTGEVEALRKAIAKYPKADTFQVDTVSMKNKNEVHKSIRLHRNAPKKVFWNGAIHNHLSIAGGPIVEGAAIHYGYSAAHARDPDRALRILSKEVRERPNCGRERYYLGREFYYRKLYDEALFYFNYYFKNATFGPEICDCNLYIARCLLALGKVEEAKAAALKAIALNSNFREAIRFVASLSGPGNKKRWNDFADSASNKNILFVRGK